MIESLPDAVALLAAAHPGDGGHVAAHEAIRAAGEGPGTKGVSDWIKANIFPLVILAAACVAGVGAVRQNASKVITVGALIVVVLLIAGIAGSASSQQTVQQWALGMFGL